MYPTGEFSSRRRTPILFSGCWNFPSKYTVPEFPETAASNPFGRVLVLFSHSCIFCWFISIFFLTAFSAFSQELYEDTPLSYLCSGTARNSRVSFGLPTCFFKYALLVVRAQADLHLEPVSYLESLPLQFRVERAQVFLRQFNV